MRNKNCLLVLALIGAFAVGLQGQETKPPVLDAGQRLAWHQQHLEMQADSPTKNLKWSHIGPMLMSGRVTDIAAPSGQPFTYYVATASGGLWKTTNEGTTWEPLFPDAPSGSTGAVTGGGAGAFWAAAQSLQSLLQKNFLFKASGIRLVSLLLL